MRDHARARIPRAVGVDQLSGKRGSIIWWLSTLTKHFLRSILRRARRTSGHHSLVTSRSRLILLADCSLSSLGLIRLFRLASLWPQQTVQRLPLLPPNPISTLKFVAIFTMTKEKRSPLLRKRKNKPMEIAPWPTVPRVMLRRRRWKALPESQGRSSTASLVLLIARVYDSTMLNPHPLLPILMHRIQSMISVQIVSCRAGCQLATALRTL